VQLARAGELHGERWIGVRQQHRRRRPAIGQGRDADGRRARRELRGIVEPTRREQREQSAPRRPQRREVARVLLLLVLPRAFVALAALVAAPLAAVLACGCRSRPPLRSVSAATRRRGDGYRCARFMAMPPIPMISIDLDEVCQMPI
jgi:hypothetical protein